ncbi:hypothetical protein JB92DRAFT_1900193 [Gautieria morchelliformis]|nr:hypothetical protein JB92DRAFT_1900193 [Gautieria morchelliformis]
MMGRGNGEKVVLAATLTESGYGDKAGEEPAVVTALGLHTHDKKIKFLERYVNLIFDAFLPPLIINGIALEAHGQNTLARFNKLTGELTGFVFRDFGRLRIHAPTLFASTGVTLDTLPDHCNAVSDVHGAERRLYHTLIHNQLRRRNRRVLGFHHDGHGWAIVGRSLRDRVPRSSSLWDAWLHPTRTTVMGKCLLRMKFDPVRGHVCIVDPTVTVLYKEVAQINRKGYRVQSKPSI